jgi:hypothetical protein
MMDRFRGSVVSQFEIDCLTIPSVDTSKPAICGQAKTGNFLGPAKTGEFYFVPSSGRKSVWTLVRQLRGPHLSTCA